MYEDVIELGTCIVYQLLMELSWVDIILGMYPNLPEGTNRSDPLGKLTQPRSLRGSDTPYTGYTPMAFSHSSFLPIRVNSRTHVSSINLRSLSFPIRSRLLRGEGTDKDTMDEDLEVTA